MTKAESLALKARVRRVVADASAEMRRKREAGICVWVDCNEPACKLPREVLFFGDDHCEPHARQAELECLADEQADDAAGRFQP